MGKVNGREVEFFSEVNMFIIANYILDWGYCTVSSLVKIFYILTHDLLN
jgi:hypothetical protein